MTRLEEIAALDFISKNDADHLLDLVRRLCEAAEACFEYEDAHVSDCRCVSCKLRSIIAEAKA